MNRSMRARTAFCPHGFLVPGLPEPWLVKRTLCTQCGKSWSGHSNKHEFTGGEELKASRFCLQCWEKHGQIFLARGYTHIVREDACEYGFLNLIHYAIKQRGYWRDQDHWETLETDLRLHLMEKRSAIEKAIRERPNEISKYVRAILNNKIQDLQETSEFNVQRFSDAYSEESEATGTDFDSTDESHNAARIVDETRSATATVTTDQGETVARSHRAARSITAKHLVESETNLVNVADPLRRPVRGSQKSPAKANAELVRVAIQEQSHRLDALTVVTQEQQAREISKAHRQLLTAIDALPHDEQTAIRMRFLDGQELRDGKPRARRDILRELRVNGNGASGWSEWDLRVLEQQAVIRLRNKIKLPALFHCRD